MECVLVVDGGCLFEKKLKSAGLNEYISIQDGIILIIVLIFYNLHNLLLSEDSCKEREFGTEVGKCDMQGEVQTLFQDEKCCIA